jgi:hypothetical protein
MTIFGPYSEYRTKAFLASGLLNEEDWAWSPDVVASEIWMALVDLLDCLIDEQSGFSKCSDSSSKSSDFNKKIKNLISKGEYEFALDIACGIGRSNPEFLSELLKQCSIDEEGYLYLPPWMRNKNDSHDHSNFFLSVLPFCESVFTLDDSLRISNIQKLNLDSESVDINYLLEYVNLTDLTTKGENITHLSSFKILSAIKSLNFTQADQLVEVNELSAFPALESLSITGTMEGLENLYISNHKNLRELNFQRFWNTESLSCLKIENNSALERVEIHASSMSENPVFSNLPELRSFEFQANEGFTSCVFESCPNLVEITVGGQDLSEIYGLSGLSNLEIFNLENISDAGLDYLNLEDCQKLHDLSLGYNSKISRLNLSGCTQIEYLYLPNDLIDLNLLGLKNVETLDLREQKKLEYLEISGCSSLIELFFPYNEHSLKSVSAIGCTSLNQVGISLSDSFNDLSFLSECPNLKMLYLLDLDHFTDLSFLYSIDGLERLQLHGCCKIIDTDGLNSSCETLEDLSIKNLTQIEEINLNSGFPHLSSLELESEKLRNLNFLYQMPNLIELDLECPSLEDLTGLNNLAQLELISLYTIPHDSLKEIAGNENLKELHIWDCLNLKNLHFLSDFPNLQHLSLRQFLELENLQPLSSVSNLKTLLLDVRQNCEELDYSQLAGLRNLESLTLFSQNLKKVPWVSQIRKLKELNLNYCTNLQDLKGISRLNNLGVLNLNHCPSLHDFEELKNLSSLQELYLRSCLSLQSVEVLEDLTQLKILDISGCEHISSDEINYLKEMIPACDISF